MPDYETSSPLVPAQTFCIATVDLVVKNPNVAPSPVLRHAINSGASDPCSRVTIGLE